jgi:hypothetical protein
MPKKKTENLKYGITQSSNMNKYNAIRTSQLYYRPGVYINKETHPEVVDFLKSKPSASEYIVSLILADMTKEKR